MKKKLITKHTLFFLAILIITTVNFKYSLFNSMPRYWFTNFQHDSESLVVGRLVKSQSEGLFSYSGFMGWVNPITEQPKKMYADGFYFIAQNDLGLNKINYQYYLYEEKLNYKGYEGYYSQSACQVLLDSVITHVLGLSGFAAIDFLYWINCFFLAGIFTVLLIWVQKKWGYAVTLTCIVGILFSQWITVFARNLYWMLWVFYLPFIASLVFLYKNEKNKEFKNKGNEGRREHKILLGSFLILFVSVLLKCLLNGFEYVTTTLVMAIVPFVFYGVYENWSWKSSLKRISAASAAALLAILVALVLLAYQLSFVKGSFAEGVNYIMYSFGKRTHGNVENYEYFYSKSLQSNTFDVFLLYWNGHVLDLSHWFSSVWMQHISKISFGAAIIFFLGLSNFVFFSKQMKLDKPFYRKQLALVVALWFSILAPLSWFIIFKSHSYIHTHMNHIVWHMPFMLFGYVLTGSMLWYYIKRIKVNYSK